MYVLKKTLFENDVYHEVEVAVSANEAELIKLAAKCNEFEYCPEEEFEWIASEHPGGLAANTFKYSDGLIKYVISEFEFDSDDEMNRIVFEAEVKSRINIASEKIQVIENKIDEYGA